MPRPEFCPDCLRDCRSHTGNYCQGSNCAASTKSSMGSLIHDQREIWESSYVDGVQKWVKKDCPRKSAGRIRRALTLRMTVSLIGQASIIGLGFFLGRITAPWFGNSRSDEHVIITHYDPRYRSYRTFSNSTYPLTYENVEFRNVTIPMTGSGTKYYIVDEDVKP